MTYTKIRINRHGAHTTLFCNPNTFIITFNFDVRILNIIDALLQIEGVIFIHIVDIVHVGDAGDRLDTARWRHVIIERYLRGLFHTGCEFRIIYRNKFQINGWLYEVASSQWGR